MRRIFLLIFLLFSFLFLVKKEAHAACSEFKVKVSDIKDNRVPIDISCDIGEYQIQIINTANNSNAITPEKFSIYSGSITKTYFLPLTGGVYKAILFQWYNPTPIAEETFTVQATAAVSPLNIHGNCSQNEISTALGCIPAGSLNEFVKWFLSKLIFVASGIAFLLMAFGAFKILTSAGSPEKVQAGKELITSALAGLVFIILSLFLLKLIGVDILQIPGFGK